MHDTCSNCDSWARALSPHEEDNFETVAGWIEATKSALKDQRSSTLDRVSISRVGKIRDAITVATKACNDYTKYRIVTAMEIASTAFKISANASGIMKGDLQSIGNSIDMVHGWLTVDEEKDWLSYYAIITPSAIISQLGKGLEKINENLTNAETKINEGFKTLSLE